MKWLLDPSVLIPLLISDHEHHEAAAQWAAGKQFAVCPIVELAFLRTAINAYQADQSAARKALSDFRKTDAPEIILDDLSPLDASPFPSAKKSTDWYLCELAQKHAMKLATFDTGMKHTASEIIPAQAGREVLKQLPRHRSAK